MDDAGLLADALFKRLRNRRGDLEGLTLSGVDDFTQYREMTARIKELYWFEQELRSLLNEQEQDDD